MAGVVCKRGRAVQGHRDGSPALAPALVLLAALSLRGLTTDPVSRDKQAGALGGHRGPHRRRWSAVARPQSVTEGQKGGQVINRGGGFTSQATAEDRLRDTPQPAGAKPHPMIRTLLGRDPCGGLAVLPPHPGLLRRPDPVWPKNRNTPIHRTLHTHDRPGFGLSCRAKYVL
jgi:hypothetical protein